MTVHHIYETLTLLAGAALIGRPSHSGYIHPSRQLTCPKSIPIVIELTFDHMTYPGGGHFSTSYRVRANGRVVDWLCWDEMLGTIAALTLTGKLHYRPSMEDAYEDEQRIKAIQNKLGPLMDFPEGQTSRYQIDWSAVNL